MHTHGNSLNGTIKHKNLRARAREEVGCSRLEWRWWRGRRSGTERKRRHEEKATRVRAAAAEAAEAPKFFLFKSNRGRGRARVVLRGGAGLRRPLARRLPH